MVTEGLVSATFVRSAAVEVVIWTGWAACSCSDWLPVLPGRRGPGVTAPKSQLVGRKEVASRVSPCQQLSYELDAVALRSRPRLRNPGALPNWGLSGVRARSHSGRVEPAQAGRA